MILATLLTVSLLQVQETPKAQPSPKVEAAEYSEKQKWWSQLSDQERDEMRRRMEDMRSMSPEARQDLEARRKVFEQEKTFILEHLNDEDRAAYDELEEREKIHFVRDQVHQRLRQRGEHLRNRFPGSEQGRKDFEKSRRKQVMEGLAKAAEEGWIGVRAKQHFEQAPLHEAMQALLEIQKWQFLAKAAESGFWKQNTIDSKQQRRISELPAQDFFREIRGLAEGRPMGPTKMRREGRGGPRGREGHGPPHDGPPEGKREGKHEGRRPGEGRPSGPPPGDGGRQR